MYDTKDKVLVSVVMITYNQENFIKEAIEGVLMQNCHYDIELIIADDKSTDKTSEVIREIIDTHSRGSWIKYIRRKENKGMMANFIDAAATAKGKYVATCEGDDYWVNPNKLQLQVEFLETHPDFAFSMGIVHQLNQKTAIITERKESIRFNENGIYTLKTYIKTPFSQTSSFVYRNSSEPFPDWFYKVHAGDQSLVVIKTGILGKIKYHDELLSIYRINGDSVSFKNDRKQSREKELFFLENINRFTGKHFNKEIFARKIVNELIYHTRSEHALIKNIGYFCYLVYTKIM